MSTSVAGGQRIQGVDQVPGHRRRMGDQGDASCPFSGARRAGSASRRSMPNFMGPPLQKLIDEPGLMMEVRLARRMRQRPVRCAAAGLVDHRRKAEPPGGVAGKLGRAAQVPEHAQRKALAGRFNIDARCGHRIQRGHVAPIAAEAIGRPFARRREVELHVGLAARRANKGLEAGVPPEFIRSRGHGARRDDEIPDPAGHPIGQGKMRGVRPGGGHVDRDRRVAGRSRVALQLKAVRRRVWTRHRSASLEHGGLGRDEPR